MLLAGREREFLGQFAFPAMSATPGAITDTDIDEFVRTYSRPDGWRGAIGLYQSMLQEGDEIATLVAGHKLNIPVLAIGAGGRRVHLRNDEPSQLRSSPISDSRRRRPLHGPRGTRPGGACPSRLLQHRHGRLEGSRFTERTPQRTLDFKRLRFVLLSS